MLQFLRVLTQDAEDELASLGCCVLLGFLVIPEAYASQFVHQFAKMWIGLLADEAREADSYLGTVVSPQDGAILYEGHLASQPGGSNGSAATCNATANDYQVIGSSILYRRQIEFLATEL